MEHVSRSKVILPVLSLVTIFAAVLSKTATAVAVPRTTLQSVACPAKGIAKVDLYNQKAQLTGIKLNAFEPVNAFQGFGLTETFRGSGASKQRFVRVQVPGQPSLAGKTIFLREHALQILNTCESLRQESSAPKLAVASTAVPKLVIPAKFFGPSAQTTAPTGGAPKPVVTSQPAVAAGKSVAPGGPAIVASKPVAALKPVGKPVGPSNSGAGTDEGVDEHEDAPQAPEHQAVPQAASGAALASGSCCAFPLKTKPTSYLSGIGRFGAGRNSRRGTRTHAGSDLYGKRGQAVLSVSPGTVIRAPYYFKAGTLAIDVRHRGGFVVRYGEISNKGFGLRLNTQIAEGQKIGEMKYVPGAKSPMLHFELYQGNQSGKLSTGGNKYHRRGDLLNPTPYLNRWKIK